MREAPAITSRSHLCEAPRLSPSHPATHPMNALSGATASNLTTSRFPLISSGSQPNQGSGLNAAFEADLSLQRRTPVWTRSITSGLSSWQLRTGIPRPAGRKLGPHVMRGTERPAPPSTSRAALGPLESQLTCGGARPLVPGGQVVQRHREPPNRCRNIGASCYRGDCRSVWPAAVGESKLAAERRVDLVVAGGVPDRGVGHV
jgi:hypothetical protein